MKIIGFQDYGIFVKTDEYDGLVHISEISDQFVMNIDELFKIDEEMLVYVMDVDHNNKRLKLSYKKAHPINKKILDEVKIIKGFTSLKNELPTWIKAKENK